MLQSSPSRHLDETRLGSLDPTAGLATGRRPNTAGLGLERAGIELTERGALKVDEQLRTTNPRVWGAGDVTGHPQFVYVAAYEGNLAARNALEGAGERVDFTSLPGDQVRHHHRAGGEHLGALPDLRRGVQAGRPDLHPRRRQAELLRGMNDGSVLAPIADDEPEVRKAAFRLLLTRGEPHRIRGHGRGVRHRDSAGCVACSRIWIGEGGSTPPATPTLHGVIHAGGALWVFLTCAAALAVFVRYFLARREMGWSAYCAASAIGMLAIFFISFVTKNIAPVLDISLTIVVVGALGDRHQAPVDEETGEGPERPIRGPVEAI